MLRRYLIIDGYNLMHALGLARRKYGPGQLQRCRSQLLRYLAQHLTGAERERTTVVFDAADAPPDLPRHATLESMEVRFASPGKEADDTIEELIAAHSAPRQVRLVSSDHRLQRSVKRRKGLFVDSEVFAAELERRGSVAEPTPETVDPEGDEADKADLAAANETENWLRIFGHIEGAMGNAFEGEGPSGPIDQADVAALKREIDREETAAKARLPRRPPDRKENRPDR